MCRATLKMWGGRLGCIGVAIGFIVHAVSNFLKRNGEVLMGCTFVVGFAIVAGTAIYFTEQGRKPVLAETIRQASTSPCVRREVAAFAVKHSSPLTVEEWKEMKKTCDAEDLYHAQQEAVKGNAQ